MNMTWQQGPYMGGLTNGIGTPLQPSAVPSLMNYQPGQWSQLAYQMAGRPQQGPYPSVPVPAGTNISNTNGGGGGGIGGTALGILGALAKNPSLLKSGVNAVSGLFNPSPGVAGASSAAADTGGATAYGTDAGALPASGTLVTGPEGGLLGASPTLSDVGTSAVDEAANAGEASATDALSNAGDSGIFGTGLSGTQALGAVGAPLALYNEVKNWQSGNTGSDALGGAGTGAAIGTAIMPGIGTALGALGGALAGGISSLFGPGKGDPETQDVQGLINATSGAGNNPALASSVQDPYLELAGLMDEKSSTLPMYSQYGRMGEQKFTNDLISRVQGDMSKGLTNPQQIYSQSIAPWVAGMGQGWNNVGPTYTATTQGLLQDMVNQIANGTYQQNFRAVGGDTPFASPTPSPQMTGLMRYQR